MSDSKTIDPIPPSRPVERPAAASPVHATRPVHGPKPVTAVGAVGQVAEIVAALGARLDTGELDRAAAMRVLVTRVIERELPALDGQSRERVVDEVVGVLSEEPAWQARLDGLWSDDAR